MPKPISVKIHDSNTNLYPLTIKLLNAGKKVLQKDYGFDEVYNIFDERGINCNKLNKYKPRN